MIILCVLTIGHNTAQAQNDSPWKVGIWQYERGNIQDALITFTALIAIKNEEYKAYYYRAKCYMQLGDIKSAEKDFKKAEQGINSFSPNLLAMYYADLGLLNDQKQNYPAAVANYTKSLDINPKVPLTYNNRGIALQHLGKYKDAINDYSLAIALDPQFALAYCNRGTAIYYNQDIAEAHAKDIESAISDFTKALDNDSSLCIAWRNRGLCYSFLKDYDNALLDLNKAIACAPNNVEFYLSRGYVHDSRNEYTEAISDFKKALAFQNKVGNKSLQAEIYNRMGVSMLRLGYFEEAFEQFNIASSLDKQFDALTHYNRAIGYAMQNNADKAVYHLKAAYKKNYFRSRKNYDAFFKSNDFNSIKQEKAFKDFIDKLKAKKASYFYNPKAS